MATLATLVLALAACGGESGGGAGEAPDYAKALAGAPEPLAKLYEQPNRLLSGGTEAFERRLADLRGYPVVVNKWASWCGPCREEMPWFQRLSARLGKRIAFLGVDSQDSSAAAKEFLRGVPVAVSKLQRPRPGDRQGDGGDDRLPGDGVLRLERRAAHVQQGQYASIDALTADIERYAR